MKKFSLAFLMIGMVNVPVETTFAMGVPDMEPKAAEAASRTPIPLPAVRNP